MEVLRRPPREAWPPARVLDALLVKMGRTGLLAQPRRGPQAGKSGDPRSQNADMVIKILEMRVTYRNHEVILIISILTIIRCQLFSFNSNNNMCGHKKLGNERNI